MASKTPSANNSQVVIGDEMSTTDGQVSSGGQQCGERPLSVNNVQQRKRRRPSKPITSKSHVVTMGTRCGSGGDVSVATGCGSGDVTVATGITDVTHCLHDNDTVPCMQQHCVISAQQLRHSVTAAPVNTAIKHDGRCVVSEKQHCAVTCELVRQHSVNSEPRHSADATTTTTHIDNPTVATTTQLAVTTVKLTTQSKDCITTTSPAAATHLMTTTVKPMGKDCTAAADTNVCYQDNLTAASALMYPGDCGVSMLLLPEQPTLTTNDDDDGDDDESGCKVMMSPASFHLIPLIAAPHPYPCIEPMYVDMATVGMATFGVGMPTAGVGIATDDVIMTTHSVGMAPATNNVTGDVSLAVAGADMETDGVAMTAAGVGVATAGMAVAMADGLVGHCIMSVDDDDITNTNPVVWPTLYHCCDNCLPTFDHPPVSNPLPTVPPTLTSINHNAHLVVDGHLTSTNLQSKLDGPRCTGGNMAVIPSSHPQSKLATRFLYAVTTSSLCGPDATNPSLTVSDTADNSCDNPMLIVGGPFSLPQSRQQVSAGWFFQDAGNVSAAGDVQGQMSAASRPDVVSSNIPRSHAGTNTTSSSSSSNSLSCSSSSNCSSVPHNHATTTTTYNSSVSSTSNSSIITNVCSANSGSSSNSSHNISACQVDVSAHHPDQQQREDYNFPHNHNDENDEASRGVQVSSVNDQSNGVNQQQELSSDNADDNGSDVNSCAKSAD